VVILYKNPQKSCVPHIFLTNMVFTPNRLASSHQLHLHSYMAFTTMKHPNTKNVVSLFMPYRNSINGKLSIY